MGIIKNKKILILPFFIFCGLIMVKNVWLCDDIWFTFRVVDNVLNGEGLVYNSGERVQVYTHPLWLFLLVGVCFFTREFVYSTILLSLFLSSVAVGVVGFKGSKDWKMGCLGVVGVTLSQAFMDYTTGGLENPLLYLIVGLFFITYLHQEISFKKLFLLSFLGALGMCTRLDLFWLFLPPLFYVFCKSSPKLKALKFTILGLLPIVLWELFSLFYYGFPFPNTAYAKVFYTGLPRREMIYQGLCYLLDHIIENPITMIMIAIGIVFSFNHNNKTTLPLLPIGISILFHLTSIIWVGGCFMRGRFLGVPFLVAMIVVMQWEVKNISKYIGFCLVVLITGLLSHSSPLHSNIKYLKEKYPGPAGLKHGKVRGWWYIIGKRKDVGIADERGFFTLRRSQWRKSSKKIEKFFKIEKKDKKKKNEVVIAVGASGKMGIVQREAYIVNIYGLTNPLIARSISLALPVWRIGHFGKRIPMGYMEAIKEKAPFQLLNPSLALYCEKLWKITRGKLFSWERIKEIFYMNIGKYEPYLNEFLSCKKYSVPFEKINLPKKAGTPWGKMGNFIICEGETLGIKLPGKMYVKGIEVSADWNDSYKIRFLEEKEVVGDTIIGPAKKPPKSGGGLFIYTLNKLPPTLLKRGITSIEIIPEKGDKLYSVGHLLITNSKNQSR